eukprot:5892658-Pleurochrysis_carterae.AAC.1
MATAHRGSNRYRLDVALVPLIPMLPPFMLSPNALQRESEREGDPTTPLNGGGLYADEVSNYVLSNTTIRACAVTLADTNISSTTPVRTSLPHFRSCPLNHNERRYRNCLCRIGTAVPSRE